MRDFFEKYADKIALDPNSDCLVWVGARITAGYGHGHRAGRHFYAHRAAYESVHGDGSADGLTIRHQCDNPPCCNPAHLLGGDQKANVADMLARGRARPARGEHHFKAKITELDAIAIRGAASAGQPINTIAARFGIKRNAVTAILDGTNWKHLGPPIAYSRYPALPPPARRGSANSVAVLNEAAVYDIRQRLLVGETATKLAMEFGVSRPTISSIKTRRIWAHLP